MSLIERKSSPFFCRNETREKRSWKKFHFIKYFRLFSHAQTRFLRSFGLSFKNEIRNAENWKFMTRFLVIYVRKWKLNRSRGTHTFLGEISHFKREKMFRVTWRKFRGCQAEPQRAQRLKQFFNFPSSFLPHPPTAIMNVIFLLKSR